ncbi:MAG: beta-ketoacyl-[acyl-carrier-protein] synthase family protein [Victivallales bacterium]|jgi:3-oxoacyl-(acyl-carrier-protein) synthase
MGNYPDTNLKCDDLLPHRRVVVTGMGVVSPLGNDIRTFWDALCAGKNGIGNVSVCDLSGFAVQQGGEVSDISLPPELAAKICKDDRSQLMVVAAVKQAIDQAGMPNSAKTALVLATNFAAAGTLDGDLGLSSPWIKGDLGYETATDLVADIWNLSGPRTTLSLSCSSGAAAIGYAADLIRSGRADYVIAGGYDTISRFAWAGLSLLRTMTEDKIRPFDKNRSGTLFSEGAGVLILESFESAKLRNSQILAELCGFGFNNNAYHMTAPPKDGQGIAETMSMALKEAGIGPDMVDHVNTHGTGTQLNDLTETAAIKKVLGMNAYDVPITSIKSMIGHQMGAAGSVEAIASILTILNGMIPPTINLTTPDPECDLPVPTAEALEADVEVVISNSSGIGGNNVSLVFRGNKKPNS